MENPAKRPLKKSLTGFEVEMFTINKKGCIVNSADNFLKRAKSDKNLTLKKEISRNIIEIASYPHETIQNTMNNLLKELEYAVDIGEKENVLLCPLGAYPGKFNPKMRDDQKYSIKKSIFGAQRSKIKDSLVNSYNFLIAADPALTCFMQSSPFYQGTYIGKDSRIIMWRGVR